MNVNTERGGVINDAIKRVAVHGKLIDKEKEGFVEHNHYAAEMSKIDDGRSNNERYQALKAADPMGRVAYNKVTFGNRRINTSLSLIGEAVGAMPPYKGFEPAVIIGHVSVYSYLDHTDADSNLPTYKHTRQWLSHVAMTADILTSGQIVTSYVDKDICGFCPDVDDSDEVKLLESLGVGDIQLSPQRSEQRGPINLSFSGSSRYNLEKNLLNDQQVSKLQTHLKKEFPLPTDSE